MRTIAGLVSVLWVILTAVPAANVAAAAAELELVRPALQGFDQPVQDQLAGVRNRLDALLADENAPPETVGDALGGMGQLYFLYDLYEVAEQCFRAASERLPEDFRWHYYRGLIAADGIALDQAVGHLERAVELRPNDLTTLLRLGRILIDAQDLEAAERRYRAALSLEPESAAARYGLGRVAFARRDWASAAEHFRQTLDLQPSATSVNNLLGMAYRQLDDEEQAIAHLSASGKGSVLFGDPLVDQLSDLVASARVHAERGIELMQQGETTAGLEELRKTVSRTPDDFLAHHNLGIGLSRADKEDEAKASYLQAIELNPSYPNSRFNLGLVLGWEGDYEGAVEQLGKAHELNPEDAATTLEWAKALALVGRYDASSAALEALVESAPPTERWRARMHLGEVLASQNKLEEAATVWHQLIENDAPPQGRAEAWSALARLSEASGDSVGALEQYRRAIEAGPGVLAARIDLARAEARAEHYDAAAGHFSAAIEIDPDDVESHFGRGLSLIMHGSLVEARDSLLNALEQLGPDERLSELAAQLLAGSPDPAVRDGVLAESLLRRIPPETTGIGHVEAMAMALAAQGRFDEARLLQERLASQIGGEASPRAARFAERARLYGQGRPCIAPWLDGGRCRASG